MIPVQIAKPSHSKLRLTRQCRLTANPSARRKHRSSWSAEPFAVRFLHPAAIPKYTNDACEDRTVILLILAMMAVLVLPALLMLAYIISHPNTLQYPATPVYDDASGQFGEPMFSSGRK